MKKPTVLLIAAAVATVSSGAGYLAAASAGKEKTAASQSTPPVAQDTLSYPQGAPQLTYLNVQPVAETPVPVMDAVAGKVDFNEERTVRIFAPIAGRVLSIRAMPGSRVGKGDALAQIDSREYAAAVADVRKAQVDLSLKRSAQARAGTLLNVGAVARKDYEVVRAEVGASQAEYARAQAALQSIAPGGGGSGYMLRAPIPGVVVARSINPGQEVRPDATSPLFVITDPKSLWVTYELSEQDVGKAHVGQPIQVRPDAGGDRVFSGTVQWVGAVVDPATRRLPVRAAIDDPEGFLRPEMFVRVTALDDRGTSAISVPNTALLNIGIHHYVFVEIRPGVLKRREVVPGLVGSERTFLTSGLRAGERVVTRGAILLNAELDGGAG